ncbi:MAG: TetR/AcrR family transcriptional regulator [Halieaceae bacterium]|nr:TetR/AcrR family transcriptional regulator [Halieaceae bacterium]
MTSNTAAKKKRNTQKHNRKLRVFRSLHHSIIEKGYASTTLEDVARGAEMSPSHLFYYFNGKEDVLEQYFAYVSERFLVQIQRLRNSEPSNQLKEFTDIWFKSGSSTKEEIGFMLECFGAAVNNKTLHTIKTSFDKNCKAVLEQIFTNSNKITALRENKDIAETTYSLMIGLRSSVYFDDIELEEARRLFLNAVKHLS